MAHGETRAITDLLAASVAFAQCDRSDLVALIDAGKVTSFPDGWPFVHEGTPADACYVLLSGTARVFRGRQEIAVLGIGDIIGEMAFIAGGQRTATVSATGQGRALRVEYDALTDVLAARPRLRETMLTVYKSRHPQA